MHTVNLQHVHIKSSCRGVAAFSHSFHCIGGSDSLVSLWKENRKPPGCVGKQVRSRGQRKGNTDGSSEAETEIHSQDPKE